MNYYTGKKQKVSWPQNNLLKDILFKIVVLSLIILFLNIFTNQFRNFFYAASYPVSNIFLQTSNSAHNFFNNFFKSSKLKEENMVLEKENQKLLSEIAVLRDQLETNSDLKTAFENIKSDNFKIIATKITGINISNDSISIDRGLDDGISEGMPLISNEKVVYGKVSKVYKNFSEVVLISAKNSTFGVKIFRSLIERKSLIKLGQLNDSTKNTVFGVLKGRGNAGVFLDLVDFESQISEEDILITSGLEGFFPKNLLVGKIISVNNSDLKPFQTAEVNPFFDLKNIENLFLITNYPR